jgi:organic hydroperoxide reductase OsmC/OhrA
VQPLPHTYSVAATGTAESNVALSTAGVPSLLSAPPVEFEGPGNQWSPEALFAAAIASCFMLTFRSVARASRLTWLNLECDVDAILERVEGVTQFTRVVTRATLTVPEGTSTELCERVLNKTEQNCLVANSLRSKRELHMEIVKQAAGVAAN